MNKNSNSKFDCFDTYWGNITDIKPIEYLDYKLEVSHVPTEKFSFPSGAVVTPTKSPLDIKDHDYKLVSTTPGKNININFTPTTCVQSEQIKKECFEWDDACGKLFFYPNGETAEPIQICNFTVSFTSMVIIHNSPDSKTIVYQCRLSISDARGGIITKELTIAAEEIKNVKLYENISPLIFIEADAKKLFLKYLHYTISNAYHSIDITHQFKFAGWWYDKSNNCWRFLSGEQKNVTASWCFTHNVNAAAQFLPNFFGTIGKEKGLVILLYLLFSITRQFFITANIAAYMRSVLSITAPTNSGKTALMTALTAPMWTGKNRACFISFLSTLAYIENDLASCDGIWAFVDDYRPTSTKKEKDIQTQKFELLCRAVGDAATPGKCITAGKADKQKALKCGIVTTNEYIPHLPPSTLLRLLPLQLKKGDFNFNRLTILQENPNTVSSFFGCYIDYLTDNQKLILSNLQNEQNTSFEKIDCMANEIAPDKKLEARRRADLATLLTMGRLLISYQNTAIQLYLDDDYYLLSEDSLNSSIKTFMHNLLTHHSPANPLPIIITKLKEAIADGSINIAPTFDLFLKQSYEGYYHNGCYFVIKECLATWLKALSSNTKGMYDIDLLSILSDAKVLSVKNKNGNPYRCSQYRATNKKGYALNENMVLSKDLLVGRPYFYKISLLEVNSND